eukprot:521499_1
MLFVLLLLMSFIAVNTQSDNKCDNDPDHNDLYKLYIDISYKWINDTATIKYQIISEDIQSLIKTQIHYGYEITDKSRNKNDLYRIENEIDVLHMHYNLTFCTVHVRTGMATIFEQYVNKGSFALDIEERINNNTYLNRVIMVESVECAIKDVLETSLKVGIILGSVAGVLFLIGIIWKCKTDRQRKCKTITTSQKLQSDEKWIEEGVEKSCTNPFINGKYKCDFEQKNKTYEMKEFNLQFMDNAVIGKGKDCHGYYNINGIYSDKTNRMILNKIYTKRGDYGGNCGEILLQARLQLEVDDSFIFKGQFYINGVSKGEWTVERCTNCTTS